MTDTNLKTHLSEDAMELYSLGRLPDAELLAFEEHILVCPACQDRLTEVENYSTTMCAALEQLRREPAPEPKAAFWSFTWARPALVLCAGAIVVVLALPVLRQSGAPQVVELTAVRGGDTTAYKAGSPLELRLASRNSGKNGQGKAEIVDLSGNQKWSGPASWTDGKWIVKTGSLEAGNYWVRVYSADAQPGADPLNEYALVLQ